MYVSNINDIGHRYMNYFYMQGSTGKLHLGNIQLNCSKTSHVLRFLPSGLHTTLWFINAVTTPKL